MVKLFQYLAVFVVLALLAPHSLGGGPHQATFKNYTVYYNAIPSKFLQPKVAKSVGVKQSRSRALLTVSIRRNTPGTHSRSVPAEVYVTTRNLIGQSRYLRFRKINTNGEITYISDFPFVNAEKMRFTLSVRPEGEPLAKEINFSQRIYRH